MKASLARRQSIAKRHLLDAVAQRRAPFETRRADAARRRPAQDNVVAGFDGSDRRPNLADDAGALVAEDERRLRGPVPAHGVQIAMAHAGRLQLDEYLARARRVELG